MQFIENLKAKAKGSNKKIVFPEAEEVRVLGAVARHKKDGIFIPVLVGNPNRVKKIAQENDFDIEGVEIVDPDNFDRFDEYVDAFVKRRNGKATKEDAEKILLDENYFATMMVYMDDVDGMVSGAIHSSADTVRPALQIVKTKEGVSRVSGMTIMVRDETVYLFSDIAINITMGNRARAEIGVETAHNAKAFGLEPRVAFLSFSTKGSASSDEQKDVARSVEMAKELDPTIRIDGEMQFDASISPRVADLKAPGSEVAGQANVFIFPNLSAGNIGYKIAERLGGFTAIGPLLQGLAKPINDLSRGCTEEDVYNVAIVTAIQAMAN